MTDDLKIKLAETQEERQGANALRHQVFVGEQGIPEEEECDEHDATALHVVALLDGHIVGTARMLTLPKSEAQFGRMAVEPTARRRGIGGSILRFLEDQARSRGVTRVVLNSQIEAVSSYRRHGYVAEGEPFFEVEIEHQRMSKSLR